LGFGFGLGAGFGELDAVGDGVGVGDVGGSSGGRIPACAKTGASRNSDAPSAAAVVAIRLRISWPSLVHPARLLDFDASSDHTSLVANE